MARVDELIGLLPQGQALEPQAQRFYGGVLGAVAELEAWLDLKTADAQRLLDPAFVPDELVPHLAAMVGVGTDLSAAYSLTVDEQRSLIPVAIALWKRKGTRRSWRDAVLFLTGKRALILDWFHHRIVAGSTLELHMIPNPGTAPGGNYDTPEQVSDVWIFDPDGLADLVKIARWLDVMRPANERINLYRALVIEDLQVGTSLWAIASPGANGDGLVTTTPQGLQSTAGNTYVLDSSVPLAADTVDGQHYHALLAVDAVGELLIFAQDDAGADAYSVLITNDAGTAATAAVRRITAGTPSTLATFTLPQRLVDGFVYRWSLDAHRLTATDTEIDVQWEGVILGSVTDAGAALTDGRPGFRGGPGGSDRATLQTALIWRHNPTPTRVGPA